MCLDCLSNVFSLRVWVYFTLKIPCFSTRIFEINIFYCLNPFFLAVFRQRREKFISYKVIINFLVLVVKIFTFSAPARDILFSVSYLLVICFLAIPIIRPHFWDRQEACKMIVIFGFFLIFFGYSLSLLICINSMCFLS